MIGYDDARQRILALCPPLAAERVGVASALHRVLAQDVASGEDLPPFDNSAMDGFALPGGGLELARGLDVAVEGSHSAGDRDADFAGACEIMTGASLPPGLDCVVPVEQASVLARTGDGRPTRIRHERPETGRSVRVCAHCGQPVAREVKA